MDDASDRLLWLRRRDSLATKAEAASRWGIPYETYKKLESGERGLTSEHAALIARHTRVSPGWLMFGEGTPEGELKVPMKGLIGAGQMMKLFEDLGEGGGTADAVLTDQAAAAFEVEGDSMLPLAHHRDIIFVGPEQRDFSSLLGHEAVVVLENGQRFFKVIERGSKPGTYNLISHNAAAETIRDVTIHSAGRFLGLRRRRR